MKEYKAFGEKKTTLLTWIRNITSGSTNTISIKKSKTHYLNKIRFTVFE